MTEAASRGAAAGLQRLSSSSGVSGMSSVRSMSVASISSEGSSESHGVEQEEISALTHDVRAFKEALAQLRTVFHHSDRDMQENVRTMAHDRLGEVLRILRVVLEKHHSLQNTELLMAAGALIQQVKGHDYEDDKASTKDFFDAIDKLALAFSSRVSEYLMGDLDAANVPFTSSAVAGKTKSYETLTGKAASVRGRSAGGDEAAAAAGEHESELLRAEHSVEALLRRAKLCAKYLKDVLAYVEKRTHLETEYAKNLSKLALTVKPLICEESHLPLQGIFCRALDNDADNCNAFLDTGSLILGAKFMEPMRARRSEHERRRKQLKEQWQRELRRTQEADGAKRKAYAIFAQRQQATKAAVELDARPERRRKVDDDAIQKAFEAESTYKKACMDVETQARHLYKVKAEVLHSLQALLLQYGQTIKAATMNFFQLQHNQSSLTPIQFQRLYESSNQYDPGQQYHEFVKRFCALASQKHALQSSASLSHVMDAATDPENFVQGRGPFLVRHAWGSFRSKQAAGSDSDSSHSGGKSREPSPVLNSPTMPHSSGDELDHKMDSGNDGQDHIIMLDDVSSAALTHKFRTVDATKGDLRCPECDFMISLNALQCIKCGLGCHKECLTKLTAHCLSNKVLSSKGVFGKDLSQHLQETGYAVPLVITKCVQEIERLALTIKGIFRVSGVKSKVEKLVEEFENDLDKVNLTGVNCHVVASVLKLYLRQLPDPLLTYELYPSFLKFAREWPAGVEGSVVELEALVQRLPADNYACLRFLMRHLSHVAAHAQDNMMPAANLGIVFGPTLLRMPGGHTSLGCLADTVHQTRAVELLVANAGVLFGATCHPASCSKAFEPAPLTTELPGFVPERPGEGPQQGEHHYSQDDHILGFISDDEIPDVFLPDYSELDPNSPILRRNLKHSTSAKIIKCSLRDYKGLEGATPEKTPSVGLEVSDASTPAHLHLRKSKSATEQANVRQIVRKESLAGGDSDAESSYLGSSIESSSFRDEMERRHLQHVVASSSVEESETEDMKSSSPRGAKGSAESRRAKAGASSSGSLIHSTKHHISVVTSHFVHRKASKSSASSSAVIVGPPIPIMPKKAEKILGETIVHKITLLDDAESKEQAKQ